jgi:hypothetical protein
MPRYFFDLYNGFGFQQDDAGQEMSSKDSVRMEVARILHEVARDELPERDRGEVRVEVKDEEGHSIFTGTLKFETEWID